MNLVDKLIHLDRENSKKIFVIGDPMTDIYLNGRLEECQDGCKKFVIEERIEVDGGAANAYRSISNWKVERALCHDRRYGAVKTRYMIDNKPIFRVDNDRIDVDFSVMRSVTLWKINSWKPDAILISDYDKGFMTPEFIRGVIDKCQEMNIVCVADVKRQPEIYKDAVLKGNCGYFSKYAEQARTWDSQAVTTYGDIAPLIWDKGEPYTFKPKHSVNCLNHIGAGDCFAAHLILALAHKFSLKESAEIAYSAGRVYVQHLYNRPPTPEEIREDFAKTL